MIYPRPFQKSSKFPGESIYSSGVNFKAGAIRGTRQVILVDEIYEH